MVASQSSFFLKVRPKVVWNEELQIPAASWDYYHFHVKQYFCPAFLRHKEACPLFAAAIQYSHFF